MNLTDDEKAVVFIDSFEALEYYKKKKILFGLYSSPKDIFKDSRPIKEYFSQTGKQKDGENLVLALQDESIRNSFIEKSVEGIDGVIAFNGKDYPEELKHVPVPPLALYYRGNKELLYGEKFSIVGSRRTFKTYEVKAEEIADRLAESGITIVSGIADGGDAAALKGAVKYGKVISVFAGGLDCVYPYSNINLVERIAANGLLISEKPCKVPPRKFYFPVRNRIIAGLGKGVLAVSGNTISGVRYTLDYALDGGKEICCLPYGLGDVGGLCKEYVKKGAFLVESADEIAEIMGYKLINRRKASLDETEEVVYELVKRGLGDTDDIAEECDLSVAEIIGALTKLEMKRLIAKEADASYHAIK